MAVAWHVDLPQTPLLEGNGETMGVNKVSFTPDVETLPMERERTTASMDALNMSFMMTLAQYRTFRTFYKITLKSGTEDFTLYDLVTDDTETYHIASQPMASLLDHSTMRVSFEVRRLPQ